MVRLLLTYIYDLLQDTDHPDKGLWDFTQCSRIVTIVLPSFCIFPSYFLLFASHLLRHFDIMPV